MKKKFIKLNDSFSHLSLGNVINIIKNESKNKDTSIQSEVFCVLFNISYINESTVNNYCIGARSIGNDYKQIYINYKKKFSHNKNVMLPIIQNVLSLVEGTIYDIDDPETINNNIYFLNIVKKLYNIAKNDFSVSLEFTSKIKTYLNSNDYILAFTELIFYAILEKKQPLYEEDKVKNMVETLLENTDISAKELQDFLLLELNEGINFSYEIYNLATTNNNSFANFQLGIEYYRGEITGNPDYITSFNYFKKAAYNNHPSAYWMMAKIILDNKITNANEEELKEAINYLNKSMELGNIAAINTLGYCYLNGLGVRKDISIAKKYFEKAASLNYAYAYNNLGKMIEKTNYEEAIIYYKKSADLNESYACNKMGLYYLEKKDYQKSFNYFNKGLNTTMRAKCLWNYFNLAKYFYITGNKEINLEKNLNQAINYYQISQSLIESLIELLFIFVKQNNKDKALEIINKIENHPNYNLKYKELIEDQLQILNKEKINQNLI